MSGKYYFGRGVLTFFFSSIFCSVSGEAGMLRTIEHSVFAYHSYVKNNESVTAVGRKFWHHFMIHQNQAGPSNKNCTLD